MSYDKPIEQCQDAAIGFREMNKVVENQRSTLEAFLLEHAPIPEVPDFSHGFGALSGHGSGPPPTVPVDGAHDTAKVSRGTMRAEYLVSIAAGAPVFTVTERTGLWNPLQRLSTGSYFVSTLGLSNVSVHLLPIGVDVVDPTGAVPRLLQMTSSPQGVYISTWAEATLTGPNLGFQLTDFGFFLVLYGQRGEAFDPAEGFSWAVAQGRSPTLWPRQRPRSRVFWRGN